MVISVDSWNSERRACWIRSSVAWSTEAVASSKMMTFERRTNARARARICRCPDISPTQIGVYLEKSCLHCW
jgi:hypothetical protein